MIWDVGLGAASNAMAAIRCFEKSYAEKDANGLRPLRLVSFEWDLDPLTLAAKNPGCFPHLRHGAPYRILENGKWEHASGLLQWELLKGDFRDLIESASIPDLIFYDPFSYKADAELWTARDLCANFQTLPAKISRALHLLRFDCRASFAFDGRVFCRRKASAPDPNQTPPSLSQERQEPETHPLSPQLLGQKWLARWRRSGSKFPTTLPTEDRPHFEKLIETHRQFLRDSFPD